MHILIGIGAALALLYFWLIGWWFARVVMFLALAAVLAFIGAACLAVPSAPAAAVVGALIGAALAWPLASIPHYVRRYQDQRSSPGLTP